jgi:hypothetical protein
MPGLTKEKREWMKKNRIIDISQFQYLSVDSSHLFTEKFIAEHSVDELQMTLNKGQRGELDFEKEEVKH